MALGFDSFDDDKYTVLIDSNRLMRYATIFSVLFLLMGLSTGLWFTSDLYAQDRDHAYIDQVNDESQADSPPARNGPSLPDNEISTPDRFGSSVDGRFYDALVRDQGAPNMIGRAMQPSDGNTAVLIQRGDSNSGMIEQHGVGHMAQLVQDGDGNTTDILQRGRDHYADVQLFGDENVFSLEQHGESNRYELNFDQGLNAPINHSVVQRGAGLSLSQTGFSITGPATVVQEGNGMEVQIEHNQ